VNLWEFVHSHSIVREQWRWRKKDEARGTILESPPFSLFVDCLSDARKHGFDAVENEFRVIEEDRLFVETCTG
jgi:hypothetical protein